MTDFAEPAVRETGMMALAKMTIIMGIATFSDVGRTGILQATILVTGE